LNPPIEAAGAPVAGGANRGSGTASASHDAAGRPVALEVTS
jgi:hypothetical protein